MGPTRSREVMDKLLAHPMLDGGQMLGESEAVLVSLMAGPDLTMAEVNRVMEQVNRQCEHAQVIMGAAIDEAFKERLAVTLIAARKRAEPSRWAKPGLPGAVRSWLKQLLPASSGRRAAARGLCRRLPLCRRTRFSNFWPGKAGAARASGRALPSCGRPSCRWRLSPKAALTRASRPSTRAKTWTCRLTSGVVWR